MSIDRRKRYDDSDEFFRLGGSVAMCLNTPAAIRVCFDAANHGIVVARVEGGIWHDPGFEPRGNCIWDGADPPIDVNIANENNLRAAQFIESMRDVHDVFILTAPPISGWPHKAQSSKSAP